MCEACDAMMVNEKVMTEKQVAKYVAEQIQAVTDSIPMLQRAAATEERERIIQLLKGNGFRHMPLEDHPNNIIAQILGK